MGTKPIRWVTRWRMVIAADPTLPGVWRRKDGGFVVRGSAMDPRTGTLREVFKVLADERDPKTAFAWLTNERAKVRAGGLHATTSYPRFSSFAGSLMEEKIRNRSLASAATRSLWADVLEDHLLQAPFASFLVDQIRVQDILEWKATIRIGEGDGEFSPHTANVWLRILKVIVNSYVTKYELEKNPVIAVEPFDTSRWRGRITREQPNSLTPNELPLFLARMRTSFPQFFALVALGFAIGARPSSLRPLRRSGLVRDYVPETGELVLRRSHTRGKTAMESTKNAEDLTLILPGDMMNILRWHVETQLIADDPNVVKKPRVTRARMAASELLFPSPRTGRFMSTTALWKPFEAVSLAMAEESKDSDKPFTKLITPKGMRRTNKDLMRAAGVRDVVAMAIANHLDEGQHHHYATVSPDEMREAVAQVIRLADFRKVHEAPSTFTRPFSQVQGSEG